MESIVFSPDFEELFKTTKDYIDDFKKYEYRFICPDNRIPNKIGYKKYSHETPCNYNLNTLEWNK
ncbi:hypothetical protein [Imtechella halotolerans]|uniref:hypothetical protein n=1 Tax=Imtechella halotolerans TaxID=1165090 RepID=UPI0002D93F19|nr:hypothetical protein [Imtechella halotolerans]WMQ63967.1 hypothetical protein PT603_03105 [Imtechella halotolerans]